MMEEISKFDLMLIQFFCIIFFQSFKNGKERLKMKTINNYLYQLVPI